MALAVLLAALLACAFSAAPAQALRVVTWNLFVYPDYNLAGRQPSFRTVMANINADVLIAQELVTAAGVDSFQNNVLNVVEPGQWANSGFFALQSSPSLEGGAIFYKPAKVAIAFTNIFVTSGPRDVLFTRVTPVGYTDLNGTFRVYSLHLKAGGPATADSTTRRLEATDVRTRLNTVPANTHFLLGGDTNIYGAYEGAYIRLTESQTDNDGRCADPLSMPGSWHNVPGYSVNLSQCPCLTLCGSFSGGGMDDRFDLWLSSLSMTDGQGVDVFAGGYSAYGNDGLHYNDDINGSGFNNAVGLTIATALKNCSDHLPVIVTVQLASRLQVSAGVSFGSVIVGATAQQTLNAGNSGVPPVDALDYSFMPPGNFTAPTGSFTAAGGAGNNHTLGMSTAIPGSKSGNLVVNSDDPDNAVKNVALSGTVLAHAIPSLDSAAVVQISDSLRFGIHEAGGFTDQAVRIHNHLYNALQARLAVSAASLTGGGGRFSIVGGFSPALLAGTGQTWYAHFDALGATEDSTYYATLTFTDADEPLPGAAVQSSITLDLSATISGASTAVGAGALPMSIAFLAPRPNPVGAATRFAFDLPRAADVALDVFDLSGRRLARIVAGAQPAGRHEVSWNARDDRGRRLAAGLYFARFTTAGYARTRRLAILP